MNAITEFIMRAPLLVIFSLLLFDDMELKFVVYLTKILFRLII